MALIKIIQSNCNRSRPAHDMVEEIGNRREAALTLISEPNISLAGSRPDWIVDTLKSACVVVSRSLPITNHGTGKGYAWVEVPRVGRIYSCYISPNCGIIEFENYLDELTHSIQNAKAPDKVIFAGDFNAASTLWGSTRTDKRGLILLDWMAANGLVITNSGEEPTFHRANQESNVDLTICSEWMADKIIDWQVLVEEENLSDHHSIEFAILLDTPRETAPPKPRFRIQNADSVKAALVKIMHNEERPKTPEDLQQLIVRACTIASSAPIYPRRSKSTVPKYWWNQDIAKARKACLKARRAIKRAKGNAEVIPTLLLCYRQCRIALRAKIAESKKQCWREFLTEIDDNPWGRPYKLIKEKKKKTLRIHLPEEDKITVLSKLFPQHERFSRLAYEERQDENFTEDESQNVTISEILQIANNIKTGKAPGPDGVPAEAVKILFKEFPETIAEVANRMIAEGRFPTAWKSAEVVLIPKGNGGYRPICLINALAKGFEAIFHERLRVFTEEHGLLSETQYGFRKHRSVLTAINRITSKAETLRNMSPNTRQIFLAIFLDVKNAFNSLPWKTILDAMVRKHVPIYLIRMVSDYLQDRTITSGATNLSMTAGVPQGSILGPLLWNIAYDDVLRLQGLPAGVELLAYADDLAVTVQAKTATEAELSANKTLQRIAEWMNGAGLSLAPEKSEAILLTGQKRVRPINLLLTDNKIQMVKEARYLGVYLDRGLRGTHHVKMATTKAAKAANAIAKILPNVCGPSRASKRRLVMSVAESIALYGASVWFSPATSARTKRDLLRRTQRIAALRIIQAFRTVSTSAALVLAGTPPWDLKAEERRRLWDHGSNSSRKERQEKERKATIGAWQDEWSSIPPGEPGSAVRDIIPNIRKWLERPGGEMNYFLTQVLTGHGDFQSYLHRFGKAPSGTCCHCDLGVEDDAAHTLLKCPSLEEARSEAVFKFKDKWDREYHSHARKPLVLPSSMAEFAEFICSTATAWQIGAEVAAQVLNAKARLERLRRNRLLPSAVRTDSGSQELSSPL